VISPIWGGKEESNSDNKGEEDRPSFRENKEKKKKKKGGKKRKFEPNSLHLNIKGKIV